MTLVTLVRRFSVQTAFAKAPLAARPAICQESTWPFASMSCCRDPGDFLISGPMDGTWLWLGGSGWFCSIVFVSCFSFKKNPHSLSLVDTSTSPYLLCFSRWRGKSWKRKMHSPPMLRRIPKVCRGDGGVYGHLLVLSASKTVCFFGVF